MDLLLIGYVFLFNSAYYFFIITEKINEVGFNNISIGEKIFFLLSLICMISGTITTSPQTYALLIDKGIFFHSLFPAHIDANGIETPRFSLSCRITLLMHGAAIVYLCKELVKKYKINFWGFLFIFKLESILGF